MKSILVILFWAASQCFSQTAPTELDRLETANGKVYENVKIRKVEPDGISIMHDGGMAKVAFENLSPELQKAFSFDPSKAEDHHQTQWSKLPEKQRFSVSPKIGIGCTIEYRDRISLIKKVEESAKAEMIEDKLKQARINDVPAGGEVWFHIKRSTIGAANTEYFLIIVTDPSGKEITRSRGTNDIAETPIGDDMWWNNEFTSIPVEIKTFVKIRLVDTLGNKTADFIIRKTPPE